jgi:hypothetical protein
MSSFIRQLEDLAAAAWELEVPHETRGLDRDACALLVDGLLARVARGRGALDVAVGARLGELSVGDRVLRLGYASVADYAREVLGIAGRTATGMARLARELQRLPLLAAAVRSGEVSVRKAEVVVGVAVATDEAAWVDLARRSTVRELQAAAGAGPGAEEWWERLTLDVSEPTRARLDEAMELAGRVLGPTSQRWERLESICQEWLGAHEGHGADEPVSDGASIEELKAAFEEETQRWEALDAVEAVAAPVLATEGKPGVGPAWDDPRDLDDALRELAGMRRGWDELVGHLALLMRALALWRRLGFATFDHYCAERLGLSGRGVEQRAWLERRLHELPGLRGALREGRLSYEQARIVAGVATPGTVAHWVARAASMTCIALRREVESHEARQTCAEGRVTVRVPSGVAFLVDEAFMAARRAAGSWLTPDECLYLLADHFVRTWEALVERRSTPERRAIERDRGFCQVPGCSRAAVHAHHVVFRSRGGGDEPENLVALCAAHHLHGVHAGRVRVSGRAPHALTWELGEVV